MILVLDLTRSLSIYEMNLEIYLFWFLYDFRLWWFPSIAINAKETDEDLKDHSEKMSFRNRIYIIPRSSHNLHKTFTNHSHYHHTTYTIRNEI